jgi:hypothetical protein
MATHIADIPKPFYCFVRDEFLDDGLKGHGNFTQCVAYGVSSLPHRAWGISIMLSNGAMVQHVPLHALTFKTDPPHTHLLDHLLVWECYGWAFATHSYDYLKEMPCKVYMKGEWENGRYLFTAAPYGDAYSMTPDQHKHFNFVQLDCGAIGAGPGNRMLMYDSSFVTLPDEKPKYRTNTRTWYVEGFGEVAPFDATIDAESSL